MPRILFSLNRWVSSLNRQVFRTLYYSSLNPVSEPSVFPQRRQQVVVPKVPSGYSIEQVIGSCPGNLADESALQKHEHKLSCRVQMAKILVDLNQDSVAESSNRKSVDEPCQKKKRVGEVSHEKLVDRLTHEIAISRVGNGDGLDCGNSIDDLLHDEVQKMLHGQGYKPQPVKHWRKCPLIKASRRAEFRPLPVDMLPEIRMLPDHVRASLQGCNVFDPPQIAQYNELLRQDGRLVSGIERIARLSRTKPGCLYHKFDSLCALATSMEGRLLVLQHRHLNHIFYALCFHPTHVVYNQALNMYERRWSAVSPSYGKA